MQYSEHTHSLVNIAQYLPNIKIPSEIIENVRLLKDNSEGGYQLFVVDQFDGNTHYFDLKKHLNKRSIPKR